MLRNTVLIGIVSLYFVMLISCSQKFHTYEAETYPRDEMPSGPGCYARCLIQDSYKITNHEFYAYTGDEFEAEGVKKTKKEIKPASTKWEKRKADRNCLSDDPDDCLVWCLIEVPGEYADHYEVVDTNLVKEFEIKQVEVKEIDKEGGFTEWREVVCDVDMTPTFYRKVQQALIDEGYEVGIHGADGLKSIATKKALSKYQRANGLPIGQLDLVTLKALNISI